MYAELRSSSRRQRQRLAGAATTLITLALLAVALLRPVMQTIVERAPEVIPTVAIKPNPDTAPPILPDIPLPNVDLSIPLMIVNLPEFETPVVSPALPSLAPVTSPDASARPSGAEAVSGRPDGTDRTEGAGRTNGTGSTLIPPVRRSSADTPFNLKLANRSGRVTSLNFCVTEGGLVSDVQIAATSGFDDTDALAIDWLAGQSFTPGTLDGVRVRMCATYDIRWTFSKAIEEEALAAARAHAAAIRQRSRYPRQFVYWPQGPFPGCDAVTICKKTAK